MQAIACSGNSNCTPQSSQQIAENMLLSMFSNFSQDQRVNNNSFPVYARPPIGQLNGSGLLGNWQVDGSAGNSCTFQGQSSPCPSLPSAPVRLDAIVNRIDLEANGGLFAPGGELRFVFSVTASTAANGGACSNSGQRADTFNIILEYKVPSDRFTTPLSWAQQWASLHDLNSNQSFTPAYLADLQSKITDFVVTKNACNSGTASCISQIRTNEILLKGSGGVNGPSWEQREFHLGNNGNTPVLTEGMIAQTPDPQFNTTGQPPCGNVNDPNGQGSGPCDPLGTLGQYINSVANNPIFQATHGAAPAVPQTFDGSAFLGGSALNPDGGVAPSFWNGSGISLETARIDFSFNTCNGCHGRETATGFVHVSNRLPAATSALSDFLLGHPQCPLQTENLGSTNGQCRESVSDPTNPAVSTLFGDIARRVLVLQTVCGNSPTCQRGAASDLLPFISKPIGVH